ncbi:hypothetical protein [Amycolatopsis sp. cmx-4-54]|uniref:hypothetical protein n=1 Tax=Amycolatopsis sp. cmx-4-54 TaxID=2790936 RepID=UPI003978A5B5
MDGRLGRQPRVVRPVTRVVHPVTRNRHRSRTVVITLDEAEDFNRLVLTVDDPAATVTAVNNATA